MDVLPPEALEGLVSYGAGGLTVVGALYYNLQALKRVGLLPSRWVPAVAIGAGAALAGTYLWFVSAFNFIALTLILSSLAFLTHGGTKQLAQPKPNPDQDSKTAHKGN